VLAGAWHSGCLDQSLFAQVPQVAGPRIERAVVLVAEITTGDHSKRADRRQRARLGAAQRVLAALVSHEFSIASAWQVDVPGERLARIEHAVERLAFAIGAAGIVAWVVASLSGMRFACVSRSTTHIWRLAVSVA
jgi:hypothetical protein